MAPTEASTVATATVSAAPSVTAMANTGFGVSNGMLYGWGDNTKGELGDGTTTNQPTPVPVTQGAIPAGVSIVQISAATDHTLALGSDGKVYAWGNNADAELGDGTTTSEETPVAVAEGAIPDGVNITKVVAVAFESYALGDDGKVYAWGDPVGPGFLGDGSASGAQTVPIVVAQGQVPDGVKIVDLAVSDTDDVALLGDDGRAYVFGPNNTQDQLGSTDTTFTTTSPVLLADPAGVIPAGVKLIRVVAGSQYFEALGDDGHIYGWGSAAGGTLGTNSSTSTATPVVAAQGDVPDGVKLTNIVGLSDSTLALGDDASAYAWGSNAQGELGDGNGSTATGFAPTAVTMPTGVHVSAIAGQQNTSEALGSDGNVYAWGSNAQGEVGDGTTGSTNNRLVPTRVALPARTTSTTLAVSGQEVFGQPVTLTATLTPADAAGSVKFDDGTTSLGTAAVTGGVATLTISSLALGDHSVTATFTPTDDTMFTGSTSDPQQVGIAVGTLTAGTPRIAGTPRVGVRLTVNPGTWTPGTMLAYRWTRNGAAIGGANGASYTPVAADAGRKLAVTVTGTKTGFSTATVTSAAVSVAPGTLKAATPSMAGTARVGDRLTAKTGTWTAGTRLAFQWTRNGAAIKGATHATYAAVAADAGRRIAVRVTGSKSGYATVTKTSATRTVAKGTLHAATPRIRGTATVGRTLTVVPGTWTGGTRLTFQWRAGGRVIAGKHGKTLKLAKAQQGKKITVRVTGTESGYTTLSRTSHATGTVKH